MSEPTCRTCAHWKPDGFDGECEKEGKRLAPMTDGCEEWERYDGQLALLKDLRERAAGDKP